MIHRIRERAAFERLARDGTRIRRSALWCTWCPEPDSTATCVAFAFGRAFGPAVSRNRMRRRLRAILRHIDQQSPLPPGLLLIGGRPSLVEHTFDDLTRLVGELLEQIGHTPTPATTTTTPTTTTTTTPTAATTPRPTPRPAPPDSRR